MVRRCVFPLCPNKMRSSSKFSFHRLPLDYPGLLKVWLVALKIDPNTEIEDLKRASHRVCSAHFAPEDFIHTKPKNKGQEPNRQNLKRSAIPIAEELSENSDFDETLFNGPELHENSILCSGASDDLSPDASPSALAQTQQKELTTDVNQKIAVLLQMKGKFVVNEKCLFQLLGRNCPSCQSKLQMEKVTYDAFLILNQWCLKCDYTNQWKNMAGAHIPAAEDGDAVEETSESQQAAAPSFNSAVVSEIVVFSDEESDASENVEEAEEEDESSIDEEWNLTGEVLLAEELELESENEEAEEESTDENKLGGGVVRELCAECGKFFNKRKHHVCAHKGRPFACNVCGKRCVSELSLKIHSRIHQENYQHLCKYCYLPFKTRVDKQKHEDAHKMKNDPYSCSDCPQTFTSYKQRRSHLLTHRGLWERKCGVCGMVFTSWGDLERHSFVHTGLKPHKCSVCDRSFKQSSHLKSHMRLHTGERPYACSHCDRAFNHNVSLKSHVQQCHASNGGAQDETGPDVEFDGVEEEPKKKAKNDLKWRRSGRPVGRPKKTAEEKNLSNTARSKRRRPKKSTSSDEESEDDGDLSFELAEEDEEEEVKKHRGLPKRAKYDSDSDFNP